jgi:pimeloyl-ACP methyl ester carboxylesterase
VALVLTGGLGLVACGAASLALGRGPAGGSHPPPPTKLPSFYTPPKQLPGGPGTLIKYERLSAPGVDGTLYRIMYVSENEQGQDIPVVGTIHVPHGAVPAGGFPVIAVAHPTSGMAPVCAFSLNAAIPNPTTNEMLKDGFEIVSSDMQPAGQPLPYIVGKVAARNVIDSVRAARRLPAVHASRDYVVWGHSEGGQAALFALMIAGSYAPELHLVGVAASAPPSELEYIYDHLSSLNQADPALWLMVEFGFHVAYGSRAPLDQVLTPLGLSFQNAAESEQCPAPTGAEKYPPDKLFRASPFAVPAWKKLMLANDPGQFKSPSHVPLLILHGGADNIVPTHTSKTLARHLCGIGQDVERWVYPGKNHANVIPVYEHDMLTWMAHRFAGRPSPDPMKPTGEPGVQVTRCP